MRTPRGCKPIEPFPKISTSGAFVSRDPEGNRLRIRYFHRESDNALVALVWFGPGTEGPPGHAHGGSIASVLDETMGATAWHAGYPVVAARLTIEYRAMLPIGTEAIIEARIESIDGRKIRTKGHLRSADGTVYAEGDGLFIALKKEQMESLRASKEGLVDARPQAKA